MNNWRLYIPRGGGIFTHASNKSFDERAFALIKASWGAWWVMIVETERFVVVQNGDKRLNIWIREDLLEGPEIRWP